MKGADLLGAIMNDSHLADADLSDVSLSSAKLNQAGLRNTRLAGAALTFAELKDADLAGSTLSSANLWAADLTRADLSCIIILRGSWVVEEDCVDLAEAELGHADLRHASLRGANLRGASLEATDLRFADLAGIKNWAEIELMNLANVFGVQNPPDGFLEWAMQAGAVAIQHDEVWLRMRMAQPSSDALYRYEPDEEVQTPTAGMAAGKSPLRLAPADIVVPIVALLSLALATAAKLFRLFAKR